VPDNQEVWIDNDGFTSIIVEIVEPPSTLVTGAGDDKAALWHLKDVTDDSDLNNVKIWKESSVQFPRLS
jgi:hypothetical protein